MKLEKTGADIIGVKGYRAEQDLLEWGPAKGTDGVKYTVIDNLAQEKNDDKHGT